MTKTTIHMVVVWIKAYQILVPLPFQFGYKENQFGTQFLTSYIM